MMHARRIGRTLWSAAFWLSLWALASWGVGKPLLLPSPAAVFVRLFELAQTKTFYTVVGNSLWNVLSGILTALLLGCALAVITARVRFLRDLLLPVMTVIKATPVASFIILALIWIGSAKVPTFTTVLIVLPLIWTNLDVGFSKSDPQLAEVARQKKLEDKRIPSDIDYHAIKGLRLEAIQKLSAVRPLTIAEASRISGVSPADISVLLIVLG